jgi:hypothetical protein
VNRDPFAIEHRDRSDRQSGRVLRAQLKIADTMHLVDIYMHTDEAIVALLDGPKPRLLPQARAALESIG